MAESPEKKIDKRIGNEFWKFRAKHGPNKIFSSKKKLWKECVKYFKWCEEHPLREEKVFCFKGDITRADVYHIRAMTIKGLCFYLKISYDTWRDYRSDEDLSEVIHEAEQIIYDQKFSGAAADLLNANIIARDLGLADKKELSGDDKKPIKISVIDEEKYKAIREKMIEEDDC